MLQIRKRTERGYFNHGWLETFHTFSFGDYYDPKFMGFRALRVINEDWIDAKTGFPTHGHRDMEIITYIVEGALEHKDTLGTHSVIRPGEAQRMSAGTGIRHSEANPIQEGRTHLYQIWILPEKNGITPGYEQKVIQAPNSEGWALAVTRDGSNGAISAHQDFSLWVGHGSKEAPLRKQIPAHRFGWLQVIKGQATWGEHALEAGDGVAFDGSHEVILTAKSDGLEVLLFDLA